MVATESAALIAAAKSAALVIEAAAAEHGVAYAACQTTYGVAVEVAVEMEDGSEEWIKIGEVEDDDIVTGVRLYDCDGNRGVDCRTLGDLVADKATWLAPAQPCDWE